ncbi:MAG: hypothetical protein M3N53_06315 [Actinomycetota bacterium]|nr:hypothetical protein [Actinomycetota bacterium]
MRLLTRAAATAAAAVVGLYLSIQVQWVLIDTFASDRSCNDVVSAVCVQPEPVPLFSLAGAAVAAGIALLLMPTRRRTDKA